MGKWIAFFFGLILFFSCQSTKDKARVAKAEQIEETQDTIQIENDELEYEITIIEIGFNAWLATQLPITHFSDNVLAMRNKEYVFEWNQRAANPSRYNPNLYNQFIDYEPHIDYGIEVNYMLFMYFEFFQQKYNQRLRGI